MIEFLFRDEKKLNLEDARFELRNKYVNERSYKASIH